MRPIRTIIVDDERPARANLRTLLARETDIEIVGECDSGPVALHDVPALRPDLVFLDVEMPEVDGFDVLEMLGSQSLIVVFVIAYDRYAIKAFDAGAVDYLLKPFADECFERTLDRVRQRVTYGPTKKRHADVFFAVKHAGRVDFLRIDAIDWIEASDYNSRLHAGSQTHLMRRSLTDLERDLDPAAFCRIHRSIVVRITRVERLEGNVAGEYDAVLTGGVRLPVSRRYRKALRERLG